jgi:Domain of unknown function (DUF397)
VSDVPGELEFKISTFSGGGSCVEVGRALGEDLEVLVRHSRFPQLGALPFTIDEWRAFVLGVKAGEFDL